MFTEIVLDKKRSLIYDIEAVQMIEKKYNKKLDHIGAAELSLEGITFFIYAGLINEDKEITPDQVHSILYTMDISLLYVFDKLTKALQSSPVKKQGVFHKKKH